MEKDDVAGIMDMLADMRAIFHEAKMDGMDTHLDRGVLQKRIKEEKKISRFLDVFQ